MNSIGLRHLSVVRRTGVRMSSTNSSYEDAIRKLNSLQSNKSTIEQIKKGLKTGQKCTNIEDMENYLRRVGIPLSKLDELSVIHVAGTKGKGSTSAMCESILRHHGFRTGFYSSPHLVAARERIRLDGRPLSREQFAEQLHHVYGLLWDSQEFDGDMPKYFAFLTVVAFHVFLRERVRVAVVEVGIGGIVDYTNVLRKVPVVGITALGLDHTSILGHTLPQIAAAKAGVMKRGCAAYCARQPADALAVLRDYAHYVQCPLTVVPDYTSYTFPETEKSHLPVDLDAYRTNASLAIQLSHAWMRATQANHTQTTIENHVNKNQNGLRNGTLDRNGDGDQIYIIKDLDKVIRNDTRNGTYKDQNGLQNKTANGIKTNHNALQNKIINDTYKDQNGLTNGSVIHTNNNLNGYNTIANIQATNKDQNGLTNGNVLNHNNNGYSKIANMHATNKAQNGLTNGNVLNHNNNGYSKIANMQATNKDQNGLTSDDTMGNLVFQVPYETAEGLRRCKWPGRYQVVEGEYAKFYLDGAHTKESMEICAQWFMDSSRSAEKTLIFSATGDRNAETLLEPLSGIPFTRIYFVIPTAHRASSTTHDNYSLVEQEELMQRCRSHAQIWQRNKSSSEKQDQQSETRPPGKNKSSSEKQDQQPETSPAARNKSNSENQVRQPDISPTKIAVLQCVADALVSIKAEGGEPSVLVTGSLHLVGAALSILDPNLSS